MLHERATLASSFGPLSIGWRHRGHHALDHAGFELRAERLVHASARTERLEDEGVGVDGRGLLLEGAVEVAPKLGLAEAIIDLVSTGSTLVMNGLRPIGDGADYLEVRLAFGPTDDDRVITLTPIGSRWMGRSRALAGMREGPRTGLRSRRLRRGRADPRKDGQEHRPCRRER